MKRRIHKLLNDAKHLHHEGRLAEAGKLYQNILKLEPQHADSMHMLGVMAHQTGHHEMAAGLIRQAIAHSKGTPSYFNNLGNVLQALGRPDEAETCYRRALILDPDNADIHNNLGSAVYALEKLEEAVQHYSRALALRADFAQACFNLAGASMKLGRSDHAVSLYKRALAIDPEYAQAHNGLGYSLQICGNLKGAISCYKRAIAIDPNYAEAQYNLGSVYQEQDLISEAAQCYQCTLALNPQHAKAHNNLGYTLLVRGETENAVSYFRRAVAIDPKYPDAFNNLGYALQEQGKFDESNSCYERALLLNPNYAEAHNNIGNILKEEGKFDDAASRYDHAIAIKPDLALAHFNRADIKIFRQGDAELSALERLSEKSDAMPPRAAQYIHFALAKALDDIGDYPRAIEHLLKGNALARKLITYNEESTAKFIQRVSAAFDNGIFTRLREAGDPSRVPIFIVGMPRSGTTLLEQILASHPQVQAGGEMLHFDAAIKITLESDQLAAFYPECVSKLDADCFRQIGKEYLSRLPELLDGKTRFTDKLPGNFLNIGLIRLALPNARIIHAVRDPLDTCVSCYTKLFRQGQEFSYDLGELGRYYRRYAELMDHWRAAVPGDAILDVAYEDLVEDLEGQCKRIVEHCNLSWDDRCLRYYKTQRSIDTASAVQVRNPIYRGSIGRWRRYEALISPLSKELDGATPCAAMLISNIQREAESHSEG